MNLFEPQQDIHEILRIYGFAAFAVVVDDPFLRNEIFFILLWRVMTETYTLFLVTGHVENGTNYCRENILKFSWKSRDGR